MGIGIFLLILFAFIFIGFAFFVSKRFPSNSMDDFLVAGRSMPTALISASVVVSWVWCSTIMGAAEAGTLYGVSGGLNYAWGAAVPFFLLIPMVTRIRKLMPKCTTFTEYLKVRYGAGVSYIYLVFGIALCFYVMMSQGVGVGTVFKNMFGVPYLLGALIPLVIVIIYITKAGLRGSIYNDCIQFFIITIIMIICIPLVMKVLGLENIYNGLKDVASNPANEYYEPEALSLTSSSGFHYGIAAVVVAFGQVLLDQGYYSKAIASTDNKSMLKAYIVGTLIAWVPIPIICGNVFGAGYIALKSQLGLASVGAGSDVAPLIMKFVFGGGVGSIFFVLMVFMAAMTTGGNCIAGAQALLSVDVYKGIINKNATEAQQLRFGKLATVVIALAMALIATFLENVSLLTLDAFSGILFAAPVSAFFVGLFWNKVNGKIAAASIVVGWIGAMIAWFSASSFNDAMFHGNLCSLLLPLVVIVIGSLFSKTKFNYQTMKYE